MSTDEQAVPGPGDQTPPAEPVAPPPAAAPRPAAAPPAETTPLETAPVETPPSAAPPAETTPVVTPPVVTPPGATLGAETRAARAAHVAERARPTPPEPVGSGEIPQPTPIAPDVPASTGTHPHDVVVGVTGAGPAPAPVPAPPAADAPEGDVFPATVPPRRIGIGGHLVGVLVGLVLGPVAVLVAGLGESRIALAYAPPQTAWIDALGTTLVALGALLLICVVLLGLWTAAVPITAGVLVTAAGLTFLVIPERAYTEVLRVFRTDANALTVGQLDIQGVSGVVLLLGVVLLAAGVAIAVARRTGRRYGRLVAAAMPPAA